MKKLIIVFAAVIFAAATVSARPTGLNIGGGVGINAWTSNYYNLRDLTGQQTYVGPYVEVGYDLKVAKNSFVYFGGRFCPSFSVYDAVEKKDAAAVTTLHMGDIFIPIRFQQNFVISPKNTTFYIEAGPAAGFLLYNYASIVAAGKAGDGVGTYTDSVEMTYENEPRANFYLGGNIGINIRRHVKIYAGGDYGFANFYKTNYAGQTYKANRWQLNFGAAFVF